MGESFEGHHIHHQVANSEFDKQKTSEAFKKESLDKLDVIEHRVAIEVDHQHLKPSINDLGLDLQKESLPFSSTINNHESLQNFCTTNDSKHINDSSLKSDNQHSQTKHNFNQIIQSVENNQSHVKHLADSQLFSDINHHHDLKDHPKNSETEQYQHEKVDFNSHKISVNSHGSSSDLKLINGHSKPTDKSTNETFMTDHGLNRDIDLKKPHENSMSKEAESHNSASISTSHDNEKDKKPLIYGFPMASESKDTFNSESSEKSGSGISPFGSFASYKSVGMPEVFSGAQNLPVAHPSHAKDHISHPSSFKNVTSTEKHAEPSKDISIDHLMPVKSYSSSIELFSNPKNEFSDMKSTTSLIGEHLPPSTQNSSSIDVNESINIKSVSGFRDDSFMKEKISQTNIPSHEHSPLMKNTHLPVITPAKDILHTNGSSLHSEITKKTDAVHAEHVQSHVDHFEKKEPKSDKIDTDNVNEPQNALNSIKMIPFSVKQEMSPEKKGTLNHPIEESTPTTDVSFSGETTASSEAHATLTPKKSEASQINVQTPTKNESKQRIKSIPTTPRSSGRLRRTVDRLSLGISTQENGVSSSALEVQEGHGISFGQIAHIEKELAKRKANYGPIVSLHRLVYGRPGEANRRKSNLRLFNGFADVQEMKRIEERLTKSATYSADDLRSIAAFLNIEFKGDKESVAKRIANFLLKPEDLGDSKPAFVIKGRSVEKRGGKRSASPRKSPAPKKNKHDHSTTTDCDEIMMSASDSVVLDPVAEDEK